MRRTNTIAKQSLGAPVSKTTDHETQYAIRIAY
jgi:hypothetical protein